MIKYKLPKLIILDIYDFWNNKIFRQIIEIVIVKKTTLEVLAKLI